MTDKKALPEEKKIKDDDEIREILGKELNDEIKKGPELEDIDIKITLTSTGYRIDPPLDSGFLQSVLEGIIKDLFIQEIFSRDDAPFMRRIERPKRK